MSFKGCRTHGSGPVNMPLQLREARLDAATKGKRSAWHCLPESLHPDLVLPLVRVLLWIPPAACGARMGRNDTGAWPSCGWKGPQVHACFTLYKMNVR